MAAARRSLLDVNVLIALLDASHVSHVAAITWFATAGGDGGWASCPITQNGCIRVMSQPTYVNPHPVAAIAERLREAVATPAHQFWPDDLSLLAGTRVDFSRIHGGRQLTDVYLLALAVEREGQLVTFDRSVPLAAVAGATAQHLLVL